jgi:hypothetical protein
MPRVEPIRFQPISPAEAVLRYAGDFIPSWAGAISIDLMPAVLVLILCVVHAAIRREGLPAASASTMTAADLVAAMRISREIEQARRTQEAAQEAPAVGPWGEADTPPAPAEPDERNVTPLSPRLGKSS